MRYASVFSGIEAATVAWHPLGWTPVLFAETDKFASAVLTHHYPNVPNVGDMTTLTGDEHGAVDLMVGGSPCQDFSVAGLRVGMDGKRGQLTIEFARLAHRLAAKKRTRWLLWENVPGVLSIDAGQAFAEFLGALCGRRVAVPKNGWQNSGIIEGLPDTFGLAYCVRDAQYFGVPQRRRRVFVVGYLGDWRRAAAVLFERQSMSGYPPPSREARQVAPTIPSRRTGGLGSGSDFDGGLVETTATLDAGYARLQGASGQDANHGHSHLIAYGGNNCSGPIDIATAVNASASASGRMDFESETFITHALRGDGFDASEDGTGRGTPLVPVAIAFSCKDHGADAGDISPTLRGMGHDGSHANAGGQVAVAMNLRGRKGGAMPEMDHLASLRAASGGSSRSYIAQMAVRRLTPRECERLQGFPDDYTLIPMKRNVVSDKKLDADYVRYMQRTARIRFADGRVIEGEILTREQCRKLAADGPRYKALGNSMAVPVMRWIAERIQMVESIATKGAPA